MSIDFERNKNNVIFMNPSRTIGSITSQNTSPESGTVIGQNSGDGIPPRNIRSFSLFDRGIIHFSPIGAHRGMAHQNVKAKTLESTSF